MKKILLLILSLIVIISLASCEFFDVLGITTATQESTAEANTTTKPITTPTNKPEDDPIEDQYSYQGFTDDEKALYTDLIGEVIPFIPNNEYYVEEYSFEYEGKTKVLIGKEGESNRFTVKRIQVYQMYETEEQIQIRKEKERIKQIEKERKYEEETKELKTKTKEIKEEYSEEKSFHRAFKS